MIRPLRLICVAILLVGVFSTGSAVAAPLTVGEVRDLKASAEVGNFSARAEWNALTYYLQGVVEGTISHHKMLAARGGKTLFCPPQRASNSLDELITAVGAAGPDTRERPVATFVVELFIQKYPCTH